MAPPRRPGTAQSRAGSPSSSLPHRVLADPDQYPDEFKAWLPRFLGQNANLQVQPMQLPRPGPIHQIGTVSQPPFQNGWSNYGGSYEPALYSLTWGVVLLGGVVTGGTIGQTIFTLPKGYRPRYSQVYVTACSVSPPQNNFGGVSVNPDGTVVAAKGDNGFFAMSGISFRQFQ